MDMLLSEDLWGPLPPGVEGGMPKAWTPGHNQQALWMLQQRDNARMPPPTNAVSPGYDREGAWAMYADNPAMPSVPSGTYPKQTLDSGAHAPPAPTSLGTEFPSQTGRAPLTAPDPVPIMSLGMRPPKETGSTFDGAPSDTYNTLHTVPSMASTSAPAVSSLSLPSFDMWGVNSRELLKSKRLDSNTGESSSYSGASRNSMSSPYSRGRRDSRARAGDWATFLARPTGNERHPQIGRSNSDATESDVFGDTEEQAQSDGDLADDVDARLPMLRTADGEDQKVLEKRRRRRESHNAVERRRRDNINSQITELATLLPESMLIDAITTSTQGGNSGSWTFGPDTATRVAQNRSHLGNWFVHPASGGATARAPENGTALEAPAAARAPPGDGGSARAVDADGVPADSCLRMSSLTAFAAALAPVNADNPALAAAQAKPNKGIILRKSVEYIRQLQQFLDMQINRNSMLEWELRQSYQHAAPQGTPTNTTPHSVSKDPGSTSAASSNVASPELQVHAADKPLQYVAWNTDLGGTQRPPPYHIFCPPQTGLAAPADATGEDARNVPIKVEQDYAFFTPVPTS
ncbi:hypothetical protein MSPP1_001806 [Malassezia sp. CBS 17886]|nr:hypothetical protein MSPP1_001806 [Malassezia sp. CBS 17886]